MNHFAHLVLAQATVESTVGNLLGDFAQGLDQQQLPPGIMAGDNHPLVQEMKLGFSSQRRRFAGIALDIYFDHLLIQHWDEFEERSLADLIAGFYQRMAEGRKLMPGENMRRVTKRMIEYDWFGSYQELDAIADALDRVAERIRFANQFDNAIVDLQRNHEMIRDGFFEFFPQLQQHVREQAFETR
jgi:acyl carrier protein phosphodiesterase